jgi:hypothetical protein
MGPEARYHPAEVFEKLSGIGYMGPCLPEEYGGVGTNFLSYVLVIEEISRADDGAVRRWRCSCTRVHTSAGALPIFVHGSEEQKACFVPDLVRRKKIGCFALTSRRPGRTLRISASERERPSKAPFDSLLVSCSYRVSMRVSSSPPGIGVPVPSVNSEAGPLRRPSAAPADAVLLAVVECL